MMDKIGNSLYFFLVIRVLGVLSSIIVLFCIALTEGWPTRLPAIFGLIFSLVGLLFISSSIASLFIWNLKKMDLTKRSIFVWVFLLCNLIAGVLFALAPTVCNYYNQFGCFEGTYSPGFKVAAAFSFINFIFGVFDVILNFVFLCRDRRDRISAQQPPSTNRAEPPSVSIIDTTADLSDPFHPRKPPSSTYV